MQNLDIDSMYSVLLGYTFLFIFFVVTMLCNKMYLFSKVKSMGPKLAILFHKKTDMAIWPGRNHQKGNSYNR